MKENTLERNRSNAATVKKRMVVKFMNEFILVRGRTNAAIAIGHLHRQQVLRITRKRTPEQNPTNATTVRKRFHVREIERDTKQYTPDRNHSSATIVGSNRSNTRKSVSSDFQTPEK